MNKTLTHLFVVGTIVLGSVLIAYIFSLQHSVIDNLSNDNADVQGASTQKVESNPQNYNLEVSIFFDKFLNIQGDGTDICQNYANYSLEDMSNELESIQQKFNKTENLFTKYQEKFLLINQECLKGNGNLDFEAIQRINSTGNQL